MTTIHNMKMPDRLPPTTPTMTITIKNWERLQVGSMPAALGRSKQGYQRRLNLPTRLPTSPLSKMPSVYHIAMNGIPFSTQAQE